ncbi:putative DNA-binding domain-containing protein [Methylocystis sp. 9N]|uniref:DNA-binding domain-containing protein n=1 Tax=Methylocystis borbori TaxID=3118750 RepID=A0ABU7XCR5_9HYPH
MHTDLASFQREFAAAILSGAESEFDRWPGFAVYRNNSTIAAIEALAGAYPTVHKILGEFGFRKMASNFFQTSPPESAVLAEYGARVVELPDLRVLSARFPYLADIARIDRMLIEAHLAHDPIAVAGLDAAQIVSAEWAQIAAVFHPATRFRWFATPASLVWLSLRQNAIENLAPPPRGASGILFTRPFGAVGAIGIDRVEYLLLEGFAQGQSVADAAIHAANVQPQADIGAAFKRLLDSGAIHYFEKREMR